MTAAETDSSPECYEIALGDGLGAPWSGWERQLDGIECRPGPQPRSCRIGASAWPGGVWLVPGGNLPFPSLLCLSVLRRARCPHSAIPCFCPVCAGLLTALLALRPFQANHPAHCAAVALVLAPACARLRTVDDRLLLLRLANTRFMKALLLPVVK